MTPPFPILVGYRGSNAIYRIWLQAGNTLIEETLQPSGQWTTSPLSKAQRLTIDRITFSRPEAATPFWLLPVMWDGGKLKVANPGANDAKLQLGCKVRSWLDNNECLSLSLEANVSGDKVRLTVFEIPEIAPASQLPVDYTGEALSGLSGTRRKPQGIGNAFQMPVAGVRIGLKGLIPAIDLYILNYSWQFANAPGIDGEVLLVFRKEIGVEPAVHKLRGFALPVYASLLEKVLPTQPAEGPKPYVVLEQRQATGYLLPVFLAATKFVWRFSVRVPHGSASKQFGDTVVNPIVDALQAIQSGNALSLLPDFDGKEAVFWSAQYLVEDSAVVPNVPDSQIQFVDANQGATTPVVIRPRYLTPEPRNAEASLSLTLPGLATSSPDGAPLCIFAVARPIEEGSLLDIPTSDSDRAEQKDRMGAWWFVLAHRLPPALGASSVQVVKMGALDLIFLPTARPAGINTDRIPNIDDGLFDERVVWAGIDPDGVVRRRDVNYRIGVFALDPGGQDDVPGDSFLSDLGARVSEDASYANLFQRSAPVVFQPSAPTVDWQKGVGFILTVSEKTTPRSNRTVQAILSVVQDGPASGLQAYVLDHEPFLFARVRAESFQAQYAQAISNEIGNWSNSGLEGDGWELAAGAGGFKLDLPPQGLGEAMHKRVGEKDIEPGKTADFRLTPATQLSLRPSYFFQQRFAEAPWNLRRILGYPGQRAPGSQMDRAQFELLYGMNVQILQPDARLAEIGSRFGLLAGAQQPKPTWPTTDLQQESYSCSRERWALLQPALRSRLAVLQPWREGASGPVPFGADNQVQIHLREQAHLRYPIPGIDEPHPFEKTGLAGGWAWGFESHNILQAILKEPNSVAAELHGLFFSCLGGWGHQKAVFDRGLSTIYCQVSMGRVESVTIERIGRIEPFWNRAKHVIIYRRSVVASRQFYLEQEPFLGSPALRKTEEYVEIIEAERPFPDSNTPVQNRGFVIACHFQGKPPRMAVNSRWGGDVGSTGWQVPLWRSDAAPSDVYPRPDVGLMCAGKEAGQAFRQSVSNPDIARFYTNTDVNAGSDPDKWPAVEGISFDRIDAQSFTAKRFDPNTPNNIPEDNAIAVGSGRFTFRLDPAPAPANIVNDRTPGAIVASVGNVTIMRGFLPAAATPSPLAPVRNLRDSLGNAFAPTLSRLSLINTQAQRPADLLEDVGTRLAGVKADLASASTSLGEQSHAFCDEVARRLENQFDLFSKPIRQEAEAAFTAIGGRFFSVVDEIRNDGSPSDDWGEVSYAGAGERLKDELEEIWFGDNGSLQTLRSMKNLAGDAVQTLSRVDGQIGNAGYAIDLALDEALGLLLAFEQWPPPDADVASILDNARDIVEEQLKAISFLIAEPVRPWIGAQQDKIRFDTTPDLNAIRVDLLKIRLTTGAARADLAKSLIEARNDIRVYVGRVRSRLQNDWAGALEILAEDNTLQPLEDLWGALQPLLNAAIDQAVSFDDLVSKINAALSLFTDGLGAQLDSALVTVRKGLGDFAAKICNSLGSKLIPALKDLLDGAAKLIGSDLLDPLAQASQIAERFLKQELERIEQQVGAVLDEIAERARLSFPQLAVNAPDISTDGILRLMRAFGNPPKLPGLQFSLPNVPLPNCGFYFVNLAKQVPDFLPKVDLSPLLSQASELLSLVKLVNPLKVDFPVVALFDRIVPFDLAKLELSKVFSNWGGLELANLFPNLKLPAIANENVKVTHGEEPTTRSAWLQIDADVPFAAQPIDVFSLAGINLRLTQARFQGSSRMDVHLGQTPKQVTSGSITGDWDLTVGGFPLATLQGCGVKYQEGRRLEFDISPDRVKLQSVLSFLADLMAGLGYQDSGFSFAVNEKGAITTLSLPLPDLQAGAFGLANLNLGFFFSINFLSGFTLGTGLSVGRRTAPFSLTIFILGGAGYFETEVTYEPRTGVFSTSVAVGIFAAASLAIALGPIRGGIYAYFGITAEFRASNAGGSSLKIAIVILFRGEVCLLGFLSVSLCLSLEASYQSGGSLTGRGTVSYSIKIGWFLTINVNASVEYSFGQASSSSSHVTAAARPAAVAGSSAGDLARRHEEMFAA